MTVLTQIFAHECFKKYSKTSLNSPAYKFGVNKSYNDVMGTVSKMSKIFLLKLIDSDSGR
jgi:hypothetical protein